MTSEAIRSGSYSARKGQIGKMRGVGERRTLQDVALMDVPYIKQRPEKDRTEVGMTGCSEKGRGCIHLFFIRSALRNFKESACVKIEGAGPYIFSLPPTLQDV